MASAAPPVTGRTTSRLRARGLRILEYNLRAYRRTWRATFFTTLLAPVLFLSAMGLGLGGLVDERSAGALGGVSYLAFLAPGLLAAQAMQTAGFESTWPVLAGFTWVKRFDAMVATPQTPRDIVLGQLYWMVVRMAIVTGVFLAVMVLFRAVASPMAILAWPAAIATGVAFAMPLHAWTATQKRETSFNVIFRFVIAPLFLFSGTFFPVSQLPDALEPIAYVTPLYHGVALTRDLALGTPHPGDLLHLGVLLLFAAVGTVLSLVFFERRLVR
jgi:lipooligosaccharide transport system permease protein